MREKLVSNADALDLRRIVLGDKSDEARYGEVKMEYLAATGTMRALCGIGLGRNKETTSEYESAVIASREFALDTANRLQRDAQRWAEVHGTIMGMRREQVWADLKIT